MEEYKILKFAPNSFLVINFIRLRASSDEIINSEEVYQYILQVTHRMCSK